MKARIGKAGNFTVLNLAVAAVNVFTLLLLSLSYVPWEERGGLKQFDARITGRIIFRHLL